MQLYHGSTVIVREPEIRISRFAKDFGAGFYCTLLKAQAVRWATRFGVGVVNSYEYTPSSTLKVLRFIEMSEEWLDFIADCRSGKSHDYDIIEGPMADDTIFNYVRSFLDGEISREAFWALAKFKHPTHQICFHTEAALTTVHFTGVEECHATS